MARRKVPIRVWLDAETDADQLAAGVPAAVARQVEETPAGAWDDVLEAFGVVEDAG